jgi:cephalosporin hydroxylase
VKPENPVPARPHLDRYNVFPHIEDTLSMTLREWMYFHNVMHRQYSLYQGLRVLKLPFDWVVLGDIIQDTRPEVIVEIGSFEGGTALWMAHLVDSLDLDTTVIGIDKDETPASVKHPRIEWVIGDCLEENTFRQVRDICGDRRGLVIEDSDHKYHITRQILEQYHDLVAIGSYLIVEDTIVEFLQLPPFPGPLRAVEEFAEDRAVEFVIDRSREKYIMTYNPKGYLLRVADRARAP